MDIDTHLALKAVTGDRDALELLFRRHQTRIWALAGAMLDSESDALDAVQSTFENASRYIETFRGESSFGTWLYKICYHACLRTAHREVTERRKHLVEVDPVALEESLPDTNSAEPCFSIDVKRAVARLPLPQRGAAVMVLMYGYTSATAAQIANVAESTMRSRVLKAKAILTVELCQYGRAAGESAND